jgi:hypothetical protein
MKIHEHIILTSFLCILLDSSLMYNKKVSWVNKDQMDESSSRTKNEIKYFGRVRV